MNRGVAVLVISSVAAAGACGGGDEEAGDIRPTEVTTAAGADDAADDAPQDPTGEPAGESPADTAPPTSEPEASLPPTAATTEPETTSPHPGDPITAIETVQVADFSRVYDLGGGLVLGATFNSVWAYNPAGGTTSQRTFASGPATGDPIGPVFYLPPEMNSFAGAAPGSSGGIGAGNANCDEIADGAAAIMDDASDPAGSCESVDLSPDCDEATNDKKAGTEGGCPATNTAAGASFYASVGDDLMHYANDGTVLAVIEGHGTNTIVGSSPVMAFDNGSLYVLRNQDVVRIENDDVAAEQPVPGAWTITTGGGSVWAVVDSGGHDNRAFLPADGGSTRIVRLDPVTLEVTGSVDVASPTFVRQVAAGDGSLWVALTGLEFGATDEDPTLLGSLELRRYDAETLELIASLDLMNELKLGRQAVDFFGNAVTSMVYEDGGGALVAVGGWKMLRFVADG